jgi:hypothetical protein
MKNPIANLIHHVGAMKIVHRSETLMSSRQIILWWEARRLFYNFAVGVTGLVAVVLMFGCGLISEKILGEPVGIPDPPIFAIFAIIAYGIMANVCYTGGWIAELVIRSAWQQDTQSFSQKAFTLGLLFSVFLTCVPALLVIPVAGIQIVLHFLK